MSAARKIRAGTLNLPPRRQRVSGANALLCANREPVQVQQLRNVVCSTAAIGEVGRDIFENPTAGQGEAGAGIDGRPSAESGNLFESPDVIGAP